VRARAGGTPPLLPRSYGAFLGKMRQFRERGEISNADYLLREDSKMPFWTYLHNALRAEGRPIVPPAYDHH